jgi:hypothetical protein
MNSLPSSSAAKSRRLAIGKRLSPNLTAAVSTEHLLTSPTSKATSRTTNVPPSYWHTVHSSLTPTRLDTGHPSSTGSIDAGKQLPPLIALDRGPGLRPLLMEGHNRATGLLLAKNPPTSTKALLATHR